MPDFHVTVKQTANRFDVSIGERQLYFEVLGLEGFLAPQPDFAIWAALPFAMREGARLKLHFPVDPAALRNARELARLWAMWLPEVYAPIEIEADQEATPPPSSTNDSVMLFSGGVDSTYALLRQMEHDDAERPLTHVLTVHGMNYNHASDTSLNELFDKTATLIDRLGLRRLVVRTDLGAQMGRLGMTHAFLLASSLFLVNRSFSRGFIAADITNAQDFLAFPWGTNHITNDLFAGSHFRMETLSQDATRIWKLDYLRRNPLAMDAISFCGNRRVQPANCGVCSKCLRTKTMFLALDGTCPEIFLVPGVTAKQIRQLDVSSNAAFKHYFEVLEIARRNRTISTLPGLEEKLQNGIESRRRRYVFRRALDQLRHVANKYRAS